MGAEIEGSETKRCRACVDKLVGARGASVGGGSAAAISGDARRARCARRARRGGEEVAATRAAGR